MVVGLQGVWSPRLGHFCGSQIYFLWLGHVNPGPLHRAFPDDSGTSRSWLSYILDDFVCTDHGSLLGPWCLWKGWCLGKGDIAGEGWQRRLGERAMLGRQTAPLRGSKELGQELGGGQEWNGADLFVNPSGDDQCCRVSFLFPPTLHLRHSPSKSNVVWERFLMTA